MKDEKQTTEKDPRPVIILRGMIVLICLLCLLFSVSMLFRSCQSDNSIITTKTNYEQILHDSIQSLRLTDSLRSIEINRIVTASINDTIAMRKQLNKLQSKYYHALKIAPDTCRSYIDTVYKESMVNDSLTKIALARKDSIISIYAVKDSAYHIATGIYERLLISKNSRIQSLLDTIPRVKRKGYIKGFGHGALVVGSIVEGVNVIGNLRR